MRRLFISAAILAASVVTAQAQDFLKGKVLKIDMSETVSERASGGGFSMPVPISGLSGSSVSLLDLELALEKAAKDDDIAMVYLNFDKVKAGGAAREELRECIRRFSASGKPVVAYGASLSNASYYLASVADKVFLHPKGSGTLNGLSSTQYFLKDLLDTLGVEVQLIRHGKFKSAGEMYIRNDISPENRRQYEALQSSLWKTITEEIAASRKVSVDSVRFWADNLVLSTADTWVDKGLVDGLKYRDEMEQYICHLFGTRNPDAVGRIGIKEYAKKAAKRKGKTKIAVLYADGEIARTGNQIAGEKFAAEVARLRKDESVAAVVFRVNSPGGEVVAADMIRREIELLGKEKPVIASYGAYAASGGYLISAGCRKIFTDNTTLTGSIGVFGMISSFGKAIKKIFKVNVVSVETSPHSALENGMRPLTQEEQDWYQKEIEAVYTDFVGVVSEGRDMTPEQVDEIAQGRVWSGRDALLIGLADEKGTLMDAIACAAEEADLDKYGIVSYPEVKSMTLAEIMGKGSSKKDDNPLVNLLENPGYRAMAQMPYIEF